MDFRPVMSQLYPDGSRGGQCGTFAHRLVQFPFVGNFLFNKISAVKRFGIPASNLQFRFKPGDIVITNESLIFGHVLMVNFVTYVENSDQAVNFQCTESNFHLDLKIHHSRVMAANSPHIIGVIRGPLLFPTNPS